jgi:tRNA(fMet)-specific endonuclease VapC
VVILDTDALSILLSDEDRLLPHLEARLKREPDRGRVTTVACVQEALGGWMNYLTSARTREKLLLGYERLRVAVEKCSAMQILPYDIPALELFESLRKTLRRLGTMDLHIACIARTRGATLLTRNLRDFRQVPGLLVEDWSRGS